MTTTKKNQGFLSVILVIMVAAVFLLSLTACKGAVDDYVLDALIGKINEIPGTITLEHEAEIKYLHKVYNALPDKEKEKVTNYKTLQSATATLEDLLAIDALEVKFTSGDTFVVGEQYVPAIDMSNLAFKGKTPTVTYAIVPGYNEAELAMNTDGSMSASGIGAAKLQAQLCYEGYNIVKTYDYDLNVSGYPVSVKVNLPFFIGNMVGNAQVSSRYGDFTYDSEEGVFCGTMPLGQQEIVCIMGGFTAVTQQVAIEKNDDNRFEMDVTEQTYGPFRRLGAKASGSWTQGDIGEVTVQRGDGEDTSMYSIANGFSHTNLMVSATIRMQMGLKDGHKSSAEGAGIVFADAAGDAYSIALKPGQGYIVLSKGSTQNISGISGTDLSDITLYNGSTLNATNGRVETVAFKNAKGKNEYDITVKLTVIRMDSMIYVLLNDVLYARFENTDLDGVAGGIGLLNFNHDAVTFSDISFTTLAEPMVAALGTRFMDIQLEELNGASVSFQGDSGGKVIVGDTLTFTVKPAEGKPVWLKINGNLVAGKMNDDGSITYTHEVTKDGMTISTLDVSEYQLHKVQVKVDLPEQIQNMMENVQVTSGGVSFQYDKDTGAFVGNIPDGAAEVTASMPGMEPVTGNVTVTPNGENTLSLKLTDFVYGPGKPIASNMSGTWKHESNNVTVQRGYNEDTSYYAVADGIAATNLMFSAEVTMQMGTVSGHKSTAEGAGIFFANTTNGLYGIGLKPGQGSVILTKNTSQNLSDIQANVTYHNGSSRNTANGNGRIWVPVLKETKGRDNYTVSVELTVVRLNTKVYVYLNDQLYVTYEIPELYGVAGGFGLFNLNHDAVTFHNITFATVDVEKYIQ